MEDTSGNLMRSLLPYEWIVRPVAKDYGIDYEIELVDQTFVTGNRIWIQLKATQQTACKSASYKLRMAETKESKIVTLDYIPFSLSVKQIRYALSCTFPLLLFVADLEENEIYWLPIQDEVRFNFLFDYGWHNQTFKTVRIPQSNRLSVERENNYSGLRWYALEPARMYAFADLHRYHSHFQNSDSLSNCKISNEGMANDEKGDLNYNLCKVEIYLESALGIDVVFGRNGFVNKQVRGKIFNTAEAVKRAQHALSRKKLSMASLNKLVSRVEIAMNLLSVVINEYPSVSEGFLVSNVAARSHVGGRTLNGWQEL